MKIGYINFSINYNFNNIQQQDEELFCNKEQQFFNCLLLLFVNNIMITMLQSNVEVVGQSENTPDLFVRYFTAANVHFSSFQ